MKWNIEWVDLQNIEHIIAECWRMSGRQLEKYCDELSRQQELIFAGELGIKFLQLMRNSIENETPLNWSKLQRDVHLMQELIQDGQAQHDAYWKLQYHALTANIAAYFSTAFGKAFTEQLAAKLELDMSEEQRMLQHDIHKIQQICATCDWENEETAQKALLLLTKEEKYYFSSWLGDAFVQTLQKRYGSKSEQPDFVLEQGKKQIVQPKSVKNTSLKWKIAWTFVICISVGLIGLWLIMQSAYRKTERGEDSNAAYTESNTVRRSDDFITDNTGVKLEQFQKTPQSEVEEDETEGDTDTNAQLQLAEQSDTYAVEEDEDLPPNRNGPGNILDEDTIDTGIENNQQPVVMPDILPQYEAFYEKYPDLFAWLKIPNTGIDHPVMQSDDEERGEQYFYLHRDYTGKKSEEGSLFVEEKSSCYPQDQNTVIYGHNMSDGRNFGILENYKDIDYFKSHQVIQYDTIYETGTYQIVAVVQTRILYQEEEGFRYYRFYHYSTDSEFQECVDFIKENQLYDSGIELQYGDQLLMLSTCEYSSPNGRLVIIAKKVA